MRTLFWPSTALALITWSATWSAPAHAQSQVSFSPVDLARGELYLPDDVALEDSEALAIEVVGASGRCEVAVSGQILYSNGPGTCAALWAMPELRATTLRLPVDGGHVDVALAPDAQMMPQALALDGSTLVAPSDFPAAPELAVLIWDGSPAKPIGWELRPLDGGRLELGAITAQVAKNAGGRYLVFGYDPSSEDMRVVSWPVIAGPAPGPSRPPVTISSLEMPSGPDPVPVELEAPTDIAGFTLQAFPPGEPLPPELRCPPRRLPQDDMIVVCVDATGPSIRYWQSPRTRYTKPNHPFYVHVVHRIEHRAQIVMGGTVGSYAPGSRGKFVLSQRGGGEGFNLEGDTAGAPVTYVATARTFAPRRPGFAPMEVRLVGADNQLVTDPFKLEFWIEETYSGAFRVGVAGILLGALDQRYRAETRPGSAQREIVATDVSTMDLDVVLGYSPYLDEGGRAASGCESAPFCFNPYFGLGLFSASSDGDLQWLKSVHLGVEWELTEAFAIGVTANLRRVERLANGMKPGYPVEGSVPTDDVFVFGVGLVINLSPEFLKIGASGAKAVLQ